MQFSSLQTEADGPLVSTDEGALKLQVIDDAIVRVVFAREAAELTAPEEHSPMILPQELEAEWSVRETDETLELETDSLRVELAKETCALTWRDADGNLLTREPEDGGKVVEEVDPADLANEPVGSPRESLDRTAYSARLEFEFADDEALYGLGQHEEGVTNYRGKMQYLYQANMKVAMPVLLSTKGYGVLFDTYALSTFRDDQHGSYFWTECADALDYYVVHGPDFDEIVSGLRQLTGEAAMLPKWSYGYVQSKERYETAEELIETVSEYREREVPLDCIVQDWQYWPDTTEDDPNFEEWSGPDGDWGQWGQKSFHEGRFPDPSGMMDDLHDLGAKLMISMWPNMLAGENHDEMAEEGFLLDDSDVQSPENEQFYYDVFQPEARELYWKQIEEGLFSHGVDAWWCDSTEPWATDWTLPVKPDPFRRAEIIGEAMKTGLDPGYVNAYSLLQAKGVYEGQRGSTDEKRVLNLTRSGYPGQQRYGAITWSGDIVATWERFREQIADGLQFTATGNPKWSLDIGAFFVDSGATWMTDADYDGGHENLGYRELYVRWFQFGAFLPLFRSHGTNTPREVWRFGEPGDRTYDTLVKFDELRYRLLPYIYSLAGRETLRDYTTLRHLAFDFREDETVHDIGDQFMFGPAMMVCPVTEPMYYDADAESLEGKAKAREVYLPEGTEWYDFWTGERYDGGQEVLADAPLEKVPIFVRAGSVVPMGPVVQHTGEKPDAPWEVRVYSGRDGSFEIYEDAGDGYDYEDGAYATTTLEWDDSTDTLTVGEREGSFPELVEERDLEVVLVSEGVGTGPDEHDGEGETVTYDGTETTIELER